MHLWAAAAKTNRSLKRGNIRIGSLALVLSMVSVNWPKPKRFSARMRNRYSWPLIRSGTTRDWAAQAGFTLNNEIRVGLWATSKLNSSECIILRIPWSSLWNVGSYLGPGFALHCFLLDEVALHSFSSVALRRFPGESAGSPCHIADPQVPRRSRQVCGSTNREIQLAHIIIWKIS